MSLYDSDEKVNRVISEYTQVLQCERCQAVFTELANVGTWGCRYHPGKFNRKLQRYECCGEQPMCHSNYNQFAEYTTWKDRYTPQLFSLGCKRCDHYSSKSKIEYEDVEYKKIAQLLPFMKPPLDERNISKASETLLRQEYGGCPTHESTPL